VVAAAIALSGCDDSDDVSDRPPTNENSAERLVKESVAEGHDEDARPPTAVNCRKVGSRVAPVGEKRPGIFRCRATYASGHVDACEVDDGGVGCVPFLTQEEGILACFAQARIPVPSKLRQQLRREQVDFDQQAIGLPETVTKRQERTFRLCLNWVKRLRWYERLR
jgi:hypothetical protein